MMLQTLVRQNKKAMKRFPYIIITLYIVFGCKTRTRNECIAKNSIVVTY